MPIQANKTEELLKLFGASFLVHTGIANCIEIKQSNFLNDYARFLQKKLTKSSCIKFKKAIQIGSFFLLCDKKTFPFDFFNYYYLIVPRVNFLQFSFVKEIK
jgi:hypothetical protein